MHRAQRRVEMASAPVSSGGVARDEVRNVEALRVEYRGVLERAVRARLPAVQRCYEAHLDRDPSFHGALELSVNVGPTRVSDIRVVHSTLPFGRDCYIQVVASAPLERRPARSVRVSYRFEFDRRQAEGGSQVATIVRALSSRLGELTECYAGVVAGMTPRPRTGVFRIRVTPSGTVDQSSVVVTEIAQINLCTLNWVRRVEVSTPPQRHCLVEFSLIFDVQGGRPVVTIGEARRQR